MTLVLSPYPSELLAYRQQFENRTLLVHQPHFINPETFFHPVDKLRPHDIIIAGDLGPYPRVPAWPFLYRRHGADSGARNRRFLSVQETVGRYDHRQEAPRLDPRSPRLRRHHEARDPTSVRLPRSVPAVPRADESARSEINANSQEQQLVDFGNDLSNAKMCIVTSSRCASAPFSVQRPTR